MVTHITRHMRTVQQFRPTQRVQCGQDTGIMIVFVHIYLTSAFRGQLHCNYELLSLQLKPKEREHFNSYLPRWLWHCFQRSIVAYRVSKTIMTHA